MLVYVSVTTPALVPECHWVLNAEVQYDAWNITIKESSMIHHLLVLVYRHPYGLF